MAEEKKIQKKEIKLEDFFTKMLSVIGKITDDQIADLLKESNQTISVAESVTGGLISHRLTNIPGSSSYFVGSVVAYNNLIKVMELGISPKLISKEGPVSKNVAIEMAEGIKKRFKTDVGLSATGCAGPSPLPPAPVGRAYVAVAGPNSSEYRELHLEGNRREIREKTAQAALGLLWLFLGGEVVT